MNRDVKIRAWDNELGMMYLQDVCNTMDGKSTIQFHPEDMQLSVYEAPCKGFYNTDLTLLRYTGVRDKHSKEIYEGDIITVKDNIRNREIRFDNGSFKYGVKARDGEWFSYLLGRAEEPKIIGNIYENPELLDSKIDNNE